MTYSKAAADAWRERAPALCDELIGPGAWDMSVSDYGFTVGVGFQRADGQRRALYLARVDRAEGGKYRSYVLSDDEARDAIMGALSD